MTTSKDVVAAIRDVVGDGKFRQPCFYAGDAPAPPYIQYKPDEYDLEFASDQVWIWRVPYIIALCTTYRDRTLERELIDALTAHGVLVKDAAPDDTDYENRIYKFLVLTEPVMEVFD